MAPPLDHKQTAWLDGLRGTASLIVLFGHCSNFGVHVIPGLDLKWTAKTGVWLFFMLSAYLLGNKLAAIFASRTAVLAQLGDYAVRRVFRIMPLYAVVLGLFTLLGKLTAAVALQHVLLRVGADQFWTIPVEMKFYALLPVFVAVLSLLRPSTRLLGSVVLFGAFVIVFVLLPFPRVDSNSTSPLAYLSFFVLGFSTGAQVSAWLRRSPRPQAQT